MFPIESGTSPYDNEKAHQLCSRKIGLAWLGFEAWLHAQMAQYSEDRFQLRHMPCSIGTEVSLR
ncbi:hypothetical protein KSZ_29090 [Dictyobacter formicarum]|uniref:Integrase catalytic domain-containing protein n=1 Tax=Dictyobacter formicarum TaxID=2778368 RepID=A0ABQ3VHP7_9CHLR|nr:hypothetical protein KSZ_29090 [Dictyobacter formicarum]